MAGRSHLNDDEIREFFLDSGSEDEELDSDLFPNSVNASSVSLDADVGLPTAESDVSMELEDDSSDNSSDSEEEDYFIGPQNLFEWRNASDSRKFQPKLFHFDDQNSGINPDLDLSENCTELECFKEIFDNDIVNHITEETNRYCMQYVNSTVLKAKSKLQKWFDTSVAEIYTFLAVILLMPHVKKNKILSYWSTDPLLETPIFGKIFSQDRFISLLRMIHFSNNSIRTPNDRLAKISTMLHSLRKKFQTILSPFKNLCIDESLLQWKGRLGIKQFMPKKRHRFGVKSFILCDCETGFIIDMVVYAGKQTTIDLNPKLGISGSVVTTLSEPYLDKGHTIYVDNWYTSPYLFQFLHDHSTGGVGTVKKDRKEMPQFPKMKTNEYEAKYTSILLSEKWVDRRDVMMLSTVHTNEIKDSGKIHYKTKEPIRKPASVIDYNENMGLIDKSDMQISFTDSARKSTKWYKKFFFHLLDIAVYNASIVHGMKTGKKLQLGEFRLNLIRQLLSEFTPNRPAATGGRKSKDQDLPLRLTARHFPDPIPATENKNKPRRACHVCKNSKLQVQRRQDTYWWCEQCAVPLCLPGCFRAYHTKKHF